MMTNKEKKESKNQNTILQDMIDWTNAKIAK